MPTSAGTFASWQYGQSNEGNLLGTIRSLDEVGVVPLNCTVNANVSSLTTTPPWADGRQIQIHDESLHCEWGLVSRQGWAVVDDAPNAALSAEYWWAGNNTDAVDIYLCAAVLGIATHDRQVRAWQQLQAGAGGLCAGGGARGHGATLRNRCRTHQRLEALLDSCRHLVDALVQL